jgi:hypothetical protein
MKQAIAATKFDLRIATPIASLSPLVDERITAGRYKRGWVRGFDQPIAMLRQPLTRRDAYSVRIAPPSTIRGEGRISATLTRHPT